MSSQEELHRCKSNESLQSPPSNFYDLPPGYTVNYPIYTTPPHGKGKGPLRFSTPPTDSKTGYTPKGKKVKSSLEFHGTITQSDDYRIDDLHHYQRESLGLQKEMHWEQRRQGEQLNFITRHLMKFCGHSPTKNTIHQKEHKSPNRPDWSPIIPIDGSIKIEPNSWEKQPLQKSSSSEN